MSARRVLSGVPANERPSVAASTDIRARSTRRRPSTANATTKKPPIRRSRARASNICFSRPTVAVLDHGEHGQRQLLRLEAEIDLRSGGQQRAQAPLGQQELFA